MRGGPSRHPSNWEINRGNGSASLGTDTACLSACRRRGCTVRAKLANSRVWTSERLIKWAVPLSVWQPYILWTIYPSAVINNGTLTRVNSFGPSDSQTQTFQPSDTSTLEHSGLVRHLTLACDVQGWNGVDSQGTLKATTNRFSVELGSAGRCSIHWWWFLVKHFECHKVVPESESSGRTRWAYELLTEARACVFVILNCSSKSKKRGNRLQILSPSHCLVPPTPYCYPPGTRPRSAGRQSDSWKGRGVGSSRVWGGGRQYTRRENLQTISRSFSPRAV
jgi:hypothetical protein